MSAPCPGGTAHGAESGQADIDSHSRPSPWPSLVLTGAALALLLVFGAAGACSIVATVLAAIFMLFLIRHLAFAVSASWTAPRDIRAESGFDFGFRPSVSVLVPCRNEELVVEGLVACLLDLDYPHHLLELVVIDDGSDDRTGEILDELAAREPRLTCLHRPPDAGGGKSAALNAGLAHARGEIVVVFDADHKCEADVIKRLVRHFADPAVGAVQGRCIIRNSEESSLARTIAIDYYCGYLVNEYGRQSLYNLPAYGGANCAVRASSLRALGGWNEGSVTEDTDLTMRLVLSGQRVRYDVTAIDTEEGVPTFGRFWRQRYRWARGHQDVWLDYRSAVWRSSHLTRAEKAETTMFLLVYHVPVLCTLGIALILLRVCGLVDWAGQVDMTPVATLLFLGPLVELGSGLIVGKAPRRWALSIPLFLLTYMLFMIVCSKAWIDRAAGRTYSWHKTPRTGHAENRAHEVAPA